MTGEPIHSGSEPVALFLTRLSKEKPVADYNDPSNSAVKPSIETLEGKLTLLFTLLTGLGAALGTIAAAYPESKEVKIALLVVSAVLAALGAAVTINHTNKRSALKGVVAEAAADFAIEKLRSDAAPAAIELLKKIGVSDPNEPAST